MTFSGLIMVFSGAMSLVLYRKFMLNMLLSLEYMALGLAWLTMNLMNSMMYEYYLVLYMLVFIVCEGALGLSLVVVLIRAYGSDLILNMNMVSC